MGAAAQSQSGLTPAPRLASRAEAALAALARLAPEGALAGLRGAELLTERAALSGTPVRSCRLLEAVDGWLAVNLARDEDWEMVSAWLEHEIDADWDSLARAMQGRSAAEIVARGHELGLAVALDAPPTPAPWVTATASSAPRRGSRLRPRVVDLSSLWAGPLCGRLLGRVGADVIKVESVQRPDGARRGSAAFFERLNRDKTCVELDFASAAGRRELETLLRSADIVIEGSRPRALRQLGIDVARLVAQTPGLTWISITGYGREPGYENRVAYGDDAGVAAGLSHVHWQQTGERTIVGDALADPLTGIHAALAGWRSYREGGGRLLSLSLVGVVRHALCSPPAALTQAG